MDRIFWVQHFDHQLASAGARPNRLVMQRNGHFVVQIKVL
jgi:hypothetical protein